MFMEQKRASGCRQDLKIETWQKGVKLKDSTMDMWYSANIYKIMFLVLLSVLSLHSHGWLDDNKLEGNNCHISLRYWHYICLGLRKTTKNSLRTGSILVEVQNGHLLNMSQILLLEPTCTIIEIILLKNNYQETKWRDACARMHARAHTHAHMRQEWVATDTRNVLREYSKNWKRLVKQWVTVTSDCHYCELRNK